MLYYVIIPVEISFTQNQLIWAQERFNFISNETLSKSVLFAILSLLGYYFSSKLYPIRVYQTDFKKIDLNYFNTTSIIIITALLYIIFFSDELLNSVSSYRGNVVNKFENSIFSFYSDFLVIFYSITGCYLRIKSKKFNFLGWFLSCFGILMGFLFSSKDEILISVLAILAPPIFNSKFNFKKNILYISIIIFVLPIFSIFFSLLRAGYSIFNFQNIKYAFSSGFAVNSDPGGPMVVLDTIVNSSNDLLWGSTYINSIISLIPKFIYPNRPLDIAQKFAIDNLEVYDSGYGIGFSPGW